jgi:hypothetical protein
MVSVRPLHADGDRPDGVIILMDGEHVDDEH